MLTKTGLIGFIKRTSLALLPQTIRDAIYTVQTLGFRYLWIDSLCILQDSIEDKLREIGKMDHIYNNSSLTISAACADGCSSGFLAKRDRWRSNMDGQPIPLPFLCPNGVVGGVSMVRFGDPNSHEPLHSRSWVLQEHLLSPRVLMYGLEQSFWICKPGSSVNNGGQTHKPEIAKLEVLKDILQRERLEGPYSAQDRWTELVQTYSRRRQSVSDDRIHAFRSLASRFQSFVKDEYIAGFWKSWPLGYLLWKRSGKIYHRPARRYPSWSWLSTGSAVTIEKNPEDFTGV